VLLYEPPEEVESQDDEDDDYQFRTQSGLEMSSIGGGEPLAVVIEKTKDNAFQRRVTIGRTNNNDIVLDDTSVSRFHAWLQQDEGTGQWQLFDAGSRNGTTVGGKRLPAKAAVVLTAGVKVKIGSVELTYYSAEGFLTLLKQRAT
jgi:pSer/pThr/pTyr-binding forkhead associated (FHA) protein